MNFYTFLPKLLNMSVTASIAVICVLILRLLLKKAPKVISYALWIIVLFRLLCPVSIESRFSLFGLMDVPTLDVTSMTNSMEYVPENIVHTEYPEVTIPVSGVSEIINDVLPEGEEQLRADPLEAPIAIGTYIWLMGVFVMGIYSVISYICLRRKLRIVSPLKQNIYLADEITTPFVMGLIFPKIYIPSNMEKSQLPYIILHEQHHIRRGDHIIKALAFLALSIHWFNPLVWLAFICASKDMEMSCDEAVVKIMGKDILADYTASLLSLATGKTVVAGMPLAFGEGDTKGRIRNLANWKKPVFGVVVIAIIACVVLGIGLMTNPEEKDSNDNHEEGYYLLISEEGIKTIEITGPYFSSSVQNADGSLYKPGEKVWLEGVTDLQGITVMLYGTSGQIVNGFSIPTNIKEDEITDTIDKNSWLLVPDNIKNEEADHKIIPYVWPTESTTISTVYGERVHPITGEKKMIDYIGIAGNEGDCVYAVSDGDIMDVGFDDTLGSYIVLATVTGEEVTYGHLSGSKVPKGAQVKAGEIIGIMGKTGTATGTFLSISVVVNGETVDPMLYLKTQIQDETIIYNGKEYKKSELCNATLKWLELSEQERMFSSYLPPEFMIFEETWGVTLTAENITSTGITIKCTQSGGEPAGELQTGSWYILEVWTKEYGWKQMPYIIDGEIGWTAEAWMIPKNDTCEWEVNWEWLYGAVPSGKYRIGKSIMDFRGSGDFEEAIYFAEFEVTE